MGTSGNLLQRGLGITLERHRSRPYRDTVDSVDYAIRLASAEKEPILKQDIVEKLEFGCPFKHGTIGEKDATLAEVLMQEGANEIKRLRDDLRWLLNKAVDESDFWTSDAGWERINKIRTYLVERSVLKA